MHLLTRPRRSKDRADPEVGYRRVYDPLTRKIHDLLTPKLSRRLYWAAETLLLVGTIGAAVWLSQADEWRPLTLVGLLLMLVLLSQWLSVEVSDGQLSASLVAIVLAMGLLGPVPAAACGIVDVVLSSSLRRVRPAVWLNNLTVFAVVPFAGGLMVRALAGDVHDVRNQHLTQSVVFGLIVLGVFIVANGFNFVLIGLELRVREGRSLPHQAREFLSVLPGELAAGALAAILAVAYMNLGLPVLFGAVVVLLIFQQLTVALLRSEDRAEQLEARSIQLVGLQLGVLRTLVRVLDSRDKTIGQHAGAVARYAKALAVELGCSEAEQEAVHTASLLHDIGKFGWPDRVLHADVVKDEDLPIVKEHPQEGAVLVGALDGYGEVADAILYHHERIDGGGYPAGLIGKEIPLASRILAICSTYDTMTAGQAYRSPMTPEEAMSELHHAAGHGQFDSELVDTFIEVLEREGSMFGRETDYETELDFERRVREMAAPRSADPMTRPPRPSPPRSRIRDRRSGVSSGPQ
jgi:putative nucleotidyltransferase with HDIG domain